MPVDTNDKKLALMDADTVWEPALVLDEATGFDQGDKQQLLWGYPGILWNPPPVVAGVDNSKLAHMEWCQTWEPGMPTNPGTLGQDDKQQLLWGYPGVLWGAPPEVPVGGDYVPTWRRRRR